MRFEMTESRIAFPNADRVESFIDSEADPVVRSLMRLVYGEFMMKITAGEFPSGRVDLLYVFEALRAAFQRGDALNSALQGAYAESNDAEWT
jgi:hypothetical protein